MSKPYDATQPYYLRGWVDPYFWRDKRTPEDIVSYINNIIYHLERNEMAQALWYWELCCLIDTSLN